MPPLSTTPPSNKWNQILSSASTSEAINQALSINASLFNQIPLPFPESQLSSHALNNLRAVRRALAVPHLASKHGWEAWSDEEDTSQEGAGQDQGHNATDHHMQDVESAHSIESDRSAQPSELSKSSEESVSQESDSSSLRAQDAQGDPVAPRPQRPELEQQAQTQRTQQKQQPNLEIEAEAESATAEFIKHANTLSTWAKTSPHMLPPQDALLKLTQSPALSTYLDTLVDATTLPPHRAALLSALTDHIPPSMAPPVQSHLILPYLQTLTSPAIREMLTAIVNFTTRHWRPTAIIFSHFTASESTPINGPLAEVLSRIAQAIPPQAALPALETFANSTWTPQSIPLAEALVARCKSHDSLPSILLPALHRNVTHMEKDVRFGKLLFAIVKDIPALSQSPTHKQTMEAICLRSKVYLGKRALTLLRQKK